MRQAYIQHIVSSVLTYRIFHPFLFTLGRRYDGADILFQDMSRKLRHKSTRREAVWRQHTLHAAYSVSSAKQSINKIATVIIDEIVSQIKHFADPKYLERITTAVRRVVKIAAETWRYARLERELIFARMPAAEDSGENISEWSEGDGEDRSNVEESTLEAREPRRVLLRLLPIIRREPTHEDLRDDSKVCDTGCLYSRGVALFSDSPPVLARIQELQQYGFEAPISPGQVGPVEQPGNSIQQSNVVPSVTSVQGPSIPTMSKLSLVEPPINILERTGAHISDGKEIVQPGENGKPQGELLELQRNRSNNSALPNNSGASGSSERSNSGSSPDAIGDLPSFRPRTAKEDTVPNWGAPGGEVPGNRDGW